MVTGKKVVTGFPKELVGHQLRAKKSDFIFHWS